MFGRFFEDFKIGATFTHAQSKTVTESDNNLFCLLTMNHHPLHLNEQYASGTSYGQIVVVGTYIFSLIVGMSVADISGKAIANLDYEKVTHHAPVFVRDTLYAETTILGKKRSKTMKGCGILYIETRAYNQNRRKVLTLRRHILIPKAKP